MHGEHEDLHVLGYGLDVGRRRTCWPTLEDFRGDRARRIEAMADRLRELGFELDDARCVRAATPASRSAARTSPTPCSRIRPTRERLRERGHRRPRRSCSRPTSSRAPPPTSRARARRSPRRSRSSTRAGGVAVWAHPFWDLDDPEEALAAIDAFAAAGLDGVEVFYATHDAEQTRCCTQAATRARAADHRLGGLPRAGARALRALPRVRALRPGAEPRPDQLTRSGRV